MLNQSRHDVNKSLSVTRRRSGIDPQMEAPPTRLFLYLPIGYTLQFHVFFKLSFSFDDSCFLGPVIHLINQN
jgi:hypothetical protein